MGGVMRGAAARPELGPGGRASCPWATARKTHRVFFYLTVFSKLPKEVRPPGFFEKIGNRPGARGSTPGPELAPHVSAAHRQTKNASRVGWI
jgi:hypothetical protein